MNRIRHLFVMNQGATFHVWSGGKRIATAEETFHGIKSITFKGCGDWNKTTEQCNSKNDVKFASATIGAYPYTIEGVDHIRWTFTNSPKQQIPYYQTSAMATLYAFRIWSTTSS